MPIRSVANPVVAALWEDRPAEHVAFVLGDYFDVAEGCDSVEAVAERIGAPELLDVMAKRALLTPELASKLEQHFGTSDGYFVRLQDDCMFPRTVAS